MDICRYMSLQRFAEILFNKELTLVSPSLWNDKYESYISQIIQTEDGKSRLRDYLTRRFNTDDDKNNEMNEFVQLVCNCTHCLCFSKDIDSEVMWNAYNFNNQTIMLKTTDRKLQSIDYTIYTSVSDVEYDLEEHGIDEMCKQLEVKDECLSVKNSHRFFLHKRRCFSYENEIRIIYTAAQNKGKKTSSFPIDNLSEFIDGIMVHPLATDEYTALIEKICEDFEISFLGRSKIYELSQLL